MQHSFDIDIAIKYGIEPAIILNNIQFWTAKNAANNHNFHDNKHWIYNSVRAWSELFPYMSANTIRNGLKKLEDCGILISGNYNQNTYDRTKWYAIVDPVKCIYQNQQMDVTKSTNGFTKSNKPIPVINTIDNPIVNTFIYNVNEIIDYFNKVTNSKSKGTKEVLANIEFLLKTYSVDEIKKVIDFIANDNWYIENKYVTLSTIFKRTKFNDKFERANCALVANQKPSYHTMGDFTNAIPGEVEF